MYYPCVLFALLLYVSAKEVPTRLLGKDICTTFQEKPAAIIAYRIWLTKSAQEMLGGSQSDIQTNLMRLLVPVRNIFYALKLELIFSDIGIVDIDDEHRTLSGGGKVFEHFEKHVRPRKELRKDIHCTIYIFASSSNELGGHADTSAAGNYSHCVGYANIHAIDTTAFHIVTHEFGHTLGATHSCPLDSCVATSGPCGIMSANYRCIERSRFQPKARQQITAYASKWNRFLPHYPPPNPQYCNFNVCRDGFLGNCGVFNDSRNNGHNIAITVVICCVILITFALLVSVLLYRFRGPWTVFRSRGTTSLFTCCVHCNLLRRSNTSSRHPRSAVHSPPEIREISSPVLKFTTAERHPTALIRNSPAILEISSPVLQSTTDENLGTYSSVDDLRRNARRPTDPTITKVNTKFSSTKSIVGPPSHIGSDIQSSSPPVGSPCVSASSDDISHPNRRLPPVRPTPLVTTQQSQSHVLLSPSTSSKPRLNEGHPLGEHDAKSGQLPPPRPHNKPTGYNVRQPTASVPTSLGNGPPRRPPKPSLSVDTTVRLLSQDGRR